MTDSSGSVEQDLSLLKAPEPDANYADAFLPTGSFGGIVTLCLRCGALVGHRAIHDTYHRFPGSPS